MPASTAPEMQPLIPDVRTDSILILGFICPPVQIIAMSMSVCLSVYLSVRSHNLKTGRPNFTKYFTHVARGRESLRYPLYFRFMDDVTFSHSGPTGIIYIVKRRQNTTSTTADIPTKFCSPMKTINYSS